MNRSPMSNAIAQGNRRRAYYSGATNNVPGKAKNKCPDRHGGCPLYNTFECDYEETGKCPKTASDK